MLKSTRTFSITLFAVLACLLGWSQYIVALLGVKLVPENIPLGPLAAAAITAGVLGRSELKAWWRQLRNFRASVGWYVLAFLAPVLIVVASVLANHVFGAPLPTPSQPKFVSMIACSTSLTPTTPKKAKTSWIRSTPIRWR